MTEEQTPLSTIPWAGLVLQAGAPGTEGRPALVESSRRVVAAIREFDKKAESQARVMIVLTVFIALLTAVLAIDVLHRVFGAS